MNPIVIGTIVFGCAFGGAVLGMVLRKVLPEQHLDAASKDTIKVGIGLVATMTALVLGIVTASAKSTFDTIDSTIKHAAASVMALDRTLAWYGPETAPMRASLQKGLATRVELTWADGYIPDPDVAKSEATRGVEFLAAALRQLTPQSEEQRWLQSRSLELAEELLETRWFISGGQGSSVPLPFVAILAFWLAVIFLSFGLFAPNNPTVVAVLLVCALSVGSAVFLILEMDGPFGGLITVSKEPMEFALAHMNK